MIKKLYSAYLESTGVSTDTRSIEKGNIWFALKGPNFNANKFAKQALEKGAPVAVIDDKAFEEEGTFLVEDVLEALQKLANHHRRQLKIPFLGITGSNGKTTTKELIREVLATKYKVHATEGNLNNHIGVPLTLLQIDESVEFAVIEMGANAQKEIKQLCEIAEPNYGLITNIGKAHLEGFGGIEGVFKGKTEMYDYLADSGGKAFVNTNNTQLFNKLMELEVPSYTYANASNYFMAELLEEKPQLVIACNGHSFETKITGAYNFENVCSALCIGKRFGVESQLSMNAVAAYDPENNRSQVIEKGEHKIVLDAYNANPSSMSEALKSFNKRQAVRKLVVIGDMLELGEEADAEHLKIGELTRDLGFEEVHLCGPLMQSAKEGNPDAHYWSDKSELVAYLSERDIKGSTILIKGSRGMSLETLLEVL